MKYFVLRFYIIVVYIISYLQNFDLNFWNFETEF
jgi:hypothetical protein